jgi:hypothetical protein
MSDHNDELESATRARLARLAARPVDASRVERKIEAVLDADSETLPRPRRRAFVGWLSAAAAVVMLVLGLVVMNNGASPVVAAPADLVALHQQVVAGGRGAVTVRSIAEAQKAIEAEWPEAPDIPVAPSEQVMACCLGHLQSRKLACVLLEGSDAPVTMVVAKESDVKPAAGAAVERGGRTFYVHEMRGVQMVATQRGDRYVCLMGELPAERLMELAERLGE